MANQFGKLPKLRLAESTRQIFSQIAADPDVYGLTDLQVAQLLSLSEELKDAFDASNQAHAEYLAKQSARNEAHADLVSALGFAMQRVYGDPAVTNEDLVRVGLAKRPQYRRSRLTFPVVLTAQILSYNSVQLTWERKNNGPRTLFSIQVQEGTEPWRPLETVTSCKFVHTGVKLANGLAYRVIARRGSQVEGAISNTASISQNLPRAA
ncbi:MAG: fibronectin type III domain-containing protein [Fimbriimonadaceae bacterium]|jgi:hypothetical protein|nr:fibronectin type III domain-containing protein [Fimbriimonadaceae bacterium]